MSTKVVPATGHSIPFTTGGDGATPGYSAVDLRRFGLAGWQEGPLSVGNATTSPLNGSYQVTQRGAGANMSVDIQASTGPGALIQGDTINQQGRYLGPPHSAVINEVIATADGTNPRVDLVVLEAKDNESDAGGLNQVQTRVVVGTPTAGATLENPVGAASLTANNGAMPLAYVLVPALAASIPTANIKDMRPKRRGRLNIATSESTSATSYAYNNLATPDRITQIVLPTDGLIAVWYQALWQNTVASNGRAAIFLSANQLKTGTSGAPVVQEATSGATTATDGILASNPFGLQAYNNSPAATEVTTGQILGANAAANGGVIYIFAAAGTYDVSVQFKNSAAGTLTASKRHLWVASMDFDNGTLT